MTLMLRYCTLIIIDAITPLPRVADMPPFADIAGCCYCYVADTPYDCFMMLLRYYGAIIDIALL